MNSSVTRRTFATRVGAVLSTLGIASSSVLIKGASAQTSGGQNPAAQNSVAPDASGIRKMNAEGKPGGEKDVAYLRTIIQREKITVVHFVPSMLEYFLLQELLDVLVLVV